jgi:hypothetical protein
MLIYMRCRQTRVLLLLQQRLPPPLLGRRRLRHRWLPGSPKRPPQRTRTREPCHRTLEREESLPTHHPLPLPIARATLRRRHRVILATRRRHPQLQASGGHRLLQSRAASRRPTRLLLLLHRLHPPLCPPRLRQVVLHRPLLLPLPPRVTRKLQRSTHAWTGSAKTKSRRLRLMSSLVERESPKITRSVIEAWAALRTKSPQADAASSFPPKTSASVAVVCTEGTSAIALDATLHCRDSSTALQTRV